MKKANKSNKNLKMILQISLNEYRSWLKNPKLMILIFAFLYVWNEICRLFADKAELMGGRKLQILEPFIGMMNSTLTQMILPLLFIVLISDYPRITPDTLMIIQRTGRKNWLFGHMLFAVEAAVTFMVSMFIVVSIPFVFKAGFSNEWSEVTTRFVIEHPNMANTAYATILPSNVYLHGGPVVSALFCFLMGVVTYFFYSMILTLFALKGKKIPGLITVTALILVGCAVSLKRSLFTWVLPAGHSLYYLHYRAALRKPYLQPWISVVYFVIIITATCIMEVIMVRKVSIIGNKNGE